MRRLVYPIVHMRPASALAVGATLGLVVAQAGGAGAPVLWLLGALAMVAMLERLAPSPATLAYTCWVPLLVVGAVGLLALMEGPGRAVVQTCWDDHGARRFLLCRSGERLDLIDGASGETLVSDAITLPPEDLDHFSSGLVPALLAGGELELDCEVLGGGRVARLAYWATGPMEEIVDGDGAWRVVGSGAVLWDLKCGRRLPFDGVVSPDGSWIVTRDGRGNLAARRVAEPSRVVHRLGQYPLSHVAFSAADELTVMETLPERPGELIIGFRTIDLSRGEPLRALTVAPEGWRLFDREHATFALSDGRIARKVGSTSDRAHRTVLVLDPTSGAVTEVGGVAPAIVGVRGTRLVLDGGALLDVDAGVARTHGVEQVRPWPPHWWTLRALWAVLVLTLLVAWCRRGGGGWQALSVLVAVALVQLAAIWFCEGGWFGWRASSQRAWQAMFQAYALAAVVLAGRGRRMTAGLVWAAPVIALMGWVI